ncbi:hypothetical protein C8J57DRAFT_1715382 [Mycena rebaudengoi]|nr:hypothetical protein C8J57DRAFT_1715382 [Mycena rebaudengoi]
MRRRPTQTNLNLSPHSWIPSHSRSSISTLKAPTGLGLVSIITPSTPTSSASLASFIRTLHHLAPPSHTFSESSPSFAEFLINNTPAVVLKELRNNEDGAAVVWGRVIKGEEEGAGRNELFLSLEVANAWCNPPPSFVPPTQVTKLRKFQKLLLSITLMHEAVHALTKYLFSPLLLTPLFGGRLLADNKGHGDSGLTFQKDYLKFHLEAT